MALHKVFEAALKAGRDAGRPGLAEGSVATARQMLDDGAKPLGAGPEVHSVQDVQIPGRDGPIAARLYRPAAQTPGIVVYLHGGGWVAGSANGFDALCRTLAVRSGCTVLNVDYRLAPDAPFPAALHDAQDALRWAHAQRAAIAGPQARLVVAGDSAGANLATISARLLGPELGIALQLLFYPPTGHDFDTPSYGEFATGLSLTRADMVWFFKHYAPASQWDDPLISPSKANLAGSPPAWIGLAHYDVLRSEGESYFLQLAKAGVKVQCTVWPDLQHGFARWFNLVDSADQAISAAARAMREACADPVA